METLTLSPKIDSKSNTNVSLIERILMITSGSYLLYKGLSQTKKNIGKITSGGAMLLRGITGFCPFYDVVNQWKNAKASNNINITTNTLINKPISEVYAFWRNFENLPHFMNHLKSIKVIDDKQSEWTAKGSGGLGKITWTAEIIKDEEDKILSWKSKRNEKVQTFGQVVFKPIGNTTEIDITISYQAPFGTAGRNAAKFLNPDFEKIVKDDVQNAKIYIETETYSV
jgi:uncharacterized membrane protein